MANLAQRGSWAQVALHRHPMVLVLVVWAAGIVVDRYWGWSVLGWLGLSALGVLLWWAKVFSDLRANWAVLALGVFSLGAAWHHWHWHHRPSDDCSRWLALSPQPLGIRAVVLQEPRLLSLGRSSPLEPPGEQNYRWTVAVRQMHLGGGWVHCSGQLAVRSPPLPRPLWPGDMVELWGQGALFPPAANPGQTDAQRQARALGLRAQLRLQTPEAVIYLRTGPWYAPRRVLAHMRRWGQKVLDRYVGPGATPLAAALLLGAKHQLSRQRADAFFRTNTIHFLAISGLHVGMLSGVLLGLLRMGLLPRRLALALVAAATVWYTLLTGAPPSAVRAMLLVLVGVASSWLFRPQQPWNTLATAALIVLVLNPCDLFRTGPQLSFLAVAVLAAWAPQWTRWRRYDALQALVWRTRPWPWRLLRWMFRWAMRSLAVAAALWTATLPLVWWRFHLIAPVAIPLSVLLTLPVAVALLGGLGVLVLGWCPPAATACGWMCHMALEVVQALVHWGVQLPAGHGFWPAPSGAWIVAFYVGFGLMYLLGMRGRKKWLAVALLGGWLLGVMVELAWWRPVRGRVEVAFLSVGHGLCVVMHLPQGQTVLYDLGGMAAPYWTARTVAQYLWSRAVYKVQLVVLSHPDVDHYNALLELSELVGVERVCTGPLFFQRSSTTVDYLAQQLQRRRIPVRELSGPEQIAQGPQWQLQALAPWPPWPSGSDNARSLVVQLQYGKHRLLLTGDLEAQGLQRLLKLPPRKTQGLLAPHHGSRSSNPPGLARWCQPRWVIISGPRPSGELSAAEKAYQEFGARVFHTGRVGAVILRWEGPQVLLQPFLAPEQQVKFRVRPGG